MTIKHPTRLPNGNSHLIPFSLLLLLLSLSSCSTAEKPDPVAKVIQSMSDSLPVIALPEEADTNLGDWKGIDL